MTLWINVSVQSHLKSLRGAWRGACSVGCIIHGHVCLSNALWPPSTANFQAVFPSVVAFSHILWRCGLVLNKSPRSFTPKQLERKLHSRQFLLYYNAVDLPPPALHSEGITAYRSWPTSKDLLPSALYRRLIWGTSKHHGAFIHQAIFMISTNYWTDKKWLKCKFTHQ